MKVTALVCMIFGSVFADTDKIQNFMTVYNGVFDDHAELGGAVKGFQLVQATILPVTINALPEKPALFLKEFVNGVLTRLLLLVVSENSQGLVVLTPYSFTHPSGLEPGEYDIDDLKDLRPEDLHEEKDCLVSFEALGPNYFVGAWPDCDHYNNGKHPVYEVTATCEAISFVPPSTADERFARLPYVLQHVGERFPLVDPPADYVNPCPP